MSSNQLIIKRNYIRGTARVHFGDVNQSTHHYHWHGCGFHCYQRDHGLHQESEIHTRAKPWRSCSVDKLIVLLFFSVASGSLFAKMTNIRLEEACGYVLHRLQIVWADSSSKIFYMKVVFNVAATKANLFFNSAMRSWIRLIQELIVSTLTSASEQFFLWRNLSAQYWPGFYFKSTSSRVVMAQFESSQMSKPLLTFVVLVSLLLTMLLINISVDLFSGHLNKTRLDKQLKTVVQLSEVGDLLSKARMLPTLLAALFNLAPALVDQNPDSWSLSRTVKIIATRIKLMGIPFLILGALILGPLELRLRRLIPPFLNGGDRS